MKPLEGEPVASSRLVMPLISMSEGRNPLGLTTLGGLFLTKGLTP